MSALQDKMKHTIDEIEGLPEGWKAVAYRVPKEILSLSSLKTWLGKLNHKTRNA